MRFYRIATLLLGVLSLVFLIKQGFELGLVAAFETMIDYYRRVMEALFGWLEPYIREALTWLHEATGIRLHLSPEWKHLFFLLGIYFGNDAATLMFNSAARPPVPGAERRYFWSGLYRLMFGLVVALCVAIGVGSVASAQDLTLAVGGSALFAIMGVWLFQIFTAFLGAQLHREDMAAESGQPEKSWSTEFFDRANRASWQAMVAVVAVIAVVVLVLTFFPNAKNPAALGTIVVAALIFLLACYWLYRGYRYSYQIAQRKRTPWRETIATSRNVYLGRSMLNIYLGAILILLTSAGLKFVGL